MISSSFYYVHTQTFHRESRRVHKRHWGTKGQNSTLSKERKENFEEEMKNTKESSGNFTRSFLVIRHVGL